MAESFIQVVEDAIKDRVKQGVDDDGLKAAVDLYAGDANSEESLERLMSAAQRLPQVLVGFTGKVTDEASTSSRFRTEQLSLDVYICTMSRRSQEGAVRAAYPLIESVERSLVGAELGLKVEGVRERDAVSAGDVQRIVDLPGFTIHQVPVTVSVQRQLPE